jgi:hypothetical protein
MDRAEQPVSVVVSIADDHLDDLTEVVADLRKVGLRVTEVMDAVGMITGTVPKSALDELECVPGVAEVERQRSVNVAPPEEDVQ